MASCPGVKGDAVPEPQRDGCPAPQVRRPAYHRRTSRGPDTRRLLDGGPGGGRIPSWEVDTAAVVRFGPAAAGDGRVTQQRACHKRQGRSMGRPGRDRSTLNASSGWCRRCLGSHLAPRGLLPDATGGARDRVRGHGRGFRHESERGAAIAPRRPVEGETNPDQAGERSRVLTLSSTPLAAERYDASRISTVRAPSSAGELLAGFLPSAASTAASTGPWQL